MARKSKSTPDLHLHCSLIYFMKLMFYNEERWGFLIGTDGLKLDRSKLIGRVEGCFIQRAGKCLSGTCRSVRLEKQNRRTDGLGHQRENAISSFSFQSDVLCYCSELHLKFRSDGWCEHECEEIGHQKYFFSPFIQPSQQVDKVKLDAGGYLDDFLNEMDRMDIKRLSTTYKHQ